MSAGRDSIDEERIDRGNGLVLGGVVEVEGEEFKIPAVLKLRGRCSTSEQAGGKMVMKVHPHEL